MKTTTKKRVGTLGLVFALCLSTLATFSFFTDREQQTTGGTAGTFDLVFEDISASKSGDNGIQSENEFAIDQVWENKSLVSEGGVLNPGDFFDLSYTIANEGSKSMDVKQLLTLNSTVELTEGAEEYKLTISRAGATETITGTLADDKMSISYEIPEIVLNGSVEIEDGVDITEQTYIVRLDFDLMAENTFQSSVVTINYNAQAKQHRNTDASHWTNWADLETGVEQFAKPQLSKPEVSLDGDTLTITPVENATGYEIYNGGTLLTTTTETTVDLSGLISDPGTYAVKVRATGSSDYMPSGYAKVEYVRELTPGLYETGTNYTVLLKSWDTLIDEGTITVEGTTITAADEYDLEGDLLIADGITDFGTVFSYNNYTTGLTIPEGVTSIAAKAFYCSYIQEIIFPDSVTSVGEQAFYSSGIKRAVLGEGITSVGTKAFYSCGNLESIGPVGSGASVEIPASVTTIDQFAFYNCTSLQSIEIPASVTTIGGGCFTYCSALESVTFAKDSLLTTIGASAFYNCTSLESIEIPATVTSIGNQAFTKCNKLVSITVAPENTVYHSAGNCIIETASKTLVAGCKNSAIPADGSVTTIGDYAFSSCTALTSIEIPASVTTIGDQAFNNCTSLSSIDLPATVSTIGNAAFQSCTSLTTITFGENSQLTTIGANAFNYCTLLTGIKLPDGVTSIGESAFCNCTALTSIEIPATVTAIGRSVFSACTNLANVTFGENSQLAILAEKAFYNCTKLTGIGPAGSGASVEIPDSVTQINKSAFHGCTNLANIELPANVAYVNSSVFSNCTALTSVTFQGTPTRILTDSFNACSNLTTINVPWAEGAVANAPWGATSATINYNYTAG